MNITDVRVRKVAKEGKMKAVVSITIDDEGIDDYLDEISAKEETRHITQFLKERAHRNGSVRCLKALQLVTRAAERQV